MSRIALIGSCIPAAALAAVLATNAQPVVLPTRRPEFEPNTDLNQLLSDAGRRLERAERKAFRQQRLRETCYRAFTGERA